MSWGGVFCIPTGFLSSKCIGSEKKVDLKALLCADKNTDLMKSRRNKMIPEEVEQMYSNLGW